MIGMTRVMVKVVASPTGKAETKWNSQARCNVALWHLFLRTGASASSPQTMATRTSMFTSALSRPMGIELFRKVRRSCLALEKIQKEKEKGKTKVAKRCV